MSVSPSGQRLDFWSDSGLQHTTTNAQGWLSPLAPYWAMFLKRPELALVPESCAAESRLHRSLQSNPLMRVSEASLALLSDADVRSNYRAFLSFRDAVLSHGTLEQFYLAQLQEGVAHPPVFINLLVQTITHHLVQDSTEAHVVRAAELLFRPQRITVHQGQLLSADAQALEDLEEDGGLGALGRLLKESQAPLREAQLRVLSADNAAQYWGHQQHRFVLDLSHETTTTLSHGLTLRLAKPRSGLKALCEVLSAWVMHFLGVPVRIEPLSAVQDPQWRWHTGLDASASALLNTLYQGQTLTTQEQGRMISLFTLRFEDEVQVLDTMVGKPVYLGLAMKDDQTLKLKPQNLLLNLPLKKAAR